MRIAIRIARMYYKLYIETEGIITGTSSHQLKNEPSRSYFKAQSAQLV